MNSSDEQKQQLLNRLQIGVSYQLLLLFVEQAFVLEKEASVKTLGNAFQEFLESLSEDEKKNFGRKMTEMLDQKAEEFENNLGRDLEPNEIVDIKEELQRIIAADKV